MESQTQNATAPRRVAIVGTTGSGKTVLARRLASSIGATHIELDALYHGPNWTPAEPDVFHARVAKAIECERWVADGNYNQAVGLIWGAADTLLWLDYPFPLVIWRLARRTFGRSLRHVELWNGNREALWWHFLPNDRSLFYWAVKTHWKRRRTFPEQIREFPHLLVHRLRSPRRAERYLAAIALGPQHHEGRLSAPEGGSASGR